MVSQLLAMARAGDNRALVAQAGVDIASLAIGPCGDFVPRSLQSASTPRLRGAGRVARLAQAPGAGDHQPRAAAARDDPQPGRQRACTTRRQAARSRYASSKTVRPGRRAAGRGLQAGHPASRARRCSSPSTARSGPTSTAPVWASRSCARSRSSTTPRSRSGRQPAPPAGLSRQGRGRVRPQGAVRCASAHPPRQSRSPRPRRRRRPAAGRPAV